MRCSRPCSTTPAFSHCATIPLAGNVPSLARMWSWAIRSNAPAKSASRTHGRFGLLALDDLEDRLDRVVATAARPEPVGPRLEPRLPLGFQRVDDPCLVALSAITGIPNGRRLVRLPRLGDVHASDRHGLERFGLVVHPVGQSCLGLRGEHHLAVHACGQRPALRSVTRRTLTSVFARDRSINFCNWRTLARSPAFDAVKIRRRSRRCRNRRTSLRRDSRNAGRARSGRLSESNARNSRTAGSAKVKWCRWAAPYSGRWRRPSGLFISHTGELSHNLHGPDDLFVEPCKICRRNPIFPCVTNLAHQIFAEEFCLDLELQNVPYVSGSLCPWYSSPWQSAWRTPGSVPDRNTVARAGGRKCSKAVCPDQIEFGLDRGGTES